MYPVFAGTFLDGFAKFSDQVIIAPGQPPVLPDVGAVFPAAKDFSGSCFPGSGHWAAHWFHSRQALAAQAAGKKGPAAEASESDDIQPSYTVPMAIVTSAGLAPYMGWHPALTRSFRLARSSVKG